jgi:hypothetical protein
VAEIEPVPAIGIQKTVYWGHDSGALAVHAVELVEAPNGSNVTCAFTVTNTGNTHLSGITIVDNDLVIPEAELMLASCPEPLATGESLVYYYETIIMPYNPSVSDNPAEDGGNRCFDFGAGTGYELTADSLLVFEVDNLKILLM